MLAAILLLALYSDIKTYKIKNTITLTFILLGLAVNFYFDGLKGLLFSLSGIIAPVLLLGILFALRMLGAGDIKLLSAVGAILGLEFVLYAIAYSFLAGGVITLVMLIFRRNGLVRLKHFTNYIRSCFLTLSLLPYTDFNDKSDRAKFHFSIAVACGALIELAFQNCRFR